MNIQCVILAAGKNTRLDTGKPKSLLEINGTSLLERHLRLFKSVGCYQFCIVTGHNPEPIKGLVVGLNEKYDIQIDLVHNERYDLENGFSVSVVENWVASKHSDGFFLTMGDHIFQDRFLSTFKNEIVNNKISQALCLAVDVPSSFNDHIDEDDVTKVLIDDQGHIVAIGKSIGDYNRYDTGLFYMKPAVFEALRKCFDHKKYSISNLVTELIDTDQATTLDVVGYLWNDVDNFSDLNITTKLDF